MTALARALIVLLAAAPALASDQQAVRRAVEDGSLRPLTEILRTVQARHPGRILDVELERAADGRRIYEIELLTPGQGKLEIHVDAHTGQILERGRAPSEPILLPLAELLRDILNQHPGHVIDVELDRGHYAIELALSDGTSVRISADARTGQWSEHHRFSQGLDDVLPMPEVIERMQRQYPGLIVEAELERDRDGSPYYEFDIQTANGRQPIEIRVDARSGRIVDIDGD